MCNEDIKINKFFALFFALFFTLYQYAIVQVILFISLGIYVFNDFYFQKKLTIKINNLKNLLYLIGWFIFFVFFALISKFWAIGVLPESNTIIVLLRMSFVGIMIFIYCDNKQQAISIIKSYIFGVFIMCATVVLLTPPSLYGVEHGINFFGKVVGQHRNSIGSAAAQSIIYIFLVLKFSKFKFSKILIIFFAFVMLISGSRGAILELLIFIAIYFFLNLKYKKTYKIIPILLLIIIPILIAVLNIPYLYNKIFVRFSDMIKTLTSGTNIDGSIYSRNLMRKVAFDIFKSHPILGAGVDGVVVYLSQFPNHYGYNFRAVYSHCNYTELAANFGIIGLLIWYVPLFLILKKMFKNINKDSIIKYLFCFLLTMIFVDNFKIPWSSDISIFSYFIFIIFYLNYYNSLKI